MKEYNKPECVNNTIITRITRRLLLLESFSDCEL